MPLCLYSLFQPPPSELSVTLLPFLRILHAEPTTTTMANFMCTGQSEKLLEERAYRGLAFVFETPAGQRNGKRSAARRRKLEHNLGQLSGEQMHTHTHTLQHKCNIDKTCVRLQRADVIVAKPSVSSAQQRHAKLHNICASQLNTKHIWPGRTVERTANRDTVRRSINVMQNWS